MATTPKRQFEKRCVKELSDLATQATRLTKEVGEAAWRLKGAHQCNKKAMLKVAAELKKISRNPDNIIQGPDEGVLDWCINVLNNPEE